jgi:hypothetical protein
MDNQGVIFPPNPPPNWKHGNAAACGEAFACPGSVSAAHKKPFSSSSYPGGAGSNSAIFARIDTHHP